MMDNRTVFDKEKALEIAYGDEDFLRELVEMFINKSPEYMSGIKEAIDSRNNETLIKSAHKLKGAVANFGEKAVFKTALELEMMGKENRLDDVEKIYGVLVREAERLVNALRKFIKSK